VSPLAGDRHPEIPMEQVRAATGDDLDRLVELTAAFLDTAGDRRGAPLVHASDVGGRPPDAVRADLVGYVTDLDRTALAGSLDDWVAGVALCRVDDGDGERRGVLDVCFVEPGARGVGLGQLLMAHSLDWFRKQRCTGVDGSALPGDREAKQFYESSGFKARLLVMHLPLD